MATETEILVITDNAVKHIARLSKEMDKEGYGLKVEVVPGGCSGYKYFMDFEENPTEEDEVLEIADVKVFVHKDSVEMLKGAHLDYMDDLQGAGFKFENPNAKSKCSCEKSFC